MAEYNTKQYLIGISLYLLKFGSVVVFLYDVYFDYYLGYIYVLKGETWYAALTLTFALIPSLIISLWTAYTFYTRNYGNRFLAHPVVVYPLCFCLQGQFAGALIWLCHALTDYPLYQSGYMQEILFSCIGITVYVEVVLGSLPQLCLQLYIVIFQGHWTTIQLNTITGSILGAGLGLSTLIPKTTTQVLACLVNTMWVICRAISIAMIESVKQYVGFAVIAAHYLFVCFLCFCDSDRRDVVEKVMASAMSMHNIYTPLLHPHVVTLSIVTAIEIILCSIFGYLFSEVSSASGRITPSSSNLTFHSRNRSLFVPVSNGSWLASPSSQVVGNQSIIATSVSTMQFKDWQYASAVFGLTITSSLVAMLFSLLGKYGEHRGSDFFNGWSAYSLDQPAEWKQM